MLQAIVNVTGRFRTGRNESCNHRRNTKGTFKQRINVIVTFREARKAIGTLKPMRNVTVTLRPGGRI